MVVQVGTASDDGSRDWPILEERDGLLGHWLSVHQAIAVIARPDKYVYGIAHHGQALRQLLLELKAALMTERINEAQD